MILGIPTNSQLCREVSGNMKGMILPYRTEEPKERIAYVHKPFPRFTEPVVFHCTEEWNVLMCVRFMRNSEFFILQSDGYTFSKDVRVSTCEGTAIICRPRHTSSDGYFYWNGIGNDFYAETSRITIGDIVELLHMSSYTRGHRYRYTM